MTFRLDYLRGDISIVALKHNHSRTKAQKYKPLPASQPGQDWQAILASQAIVYAAVKARNLAQYNKKLENLKSYKNACTIL